MSTKDFSIKTKDNDNYRKKNRNQLIIDGERIRINYSRIVYI